MEVGSCFCVVAATVFIFTVLWKLKEGCGDGSWAAAAGALAGALVGASLYLTVPPVVCGVAFFSCSFALIYLTERRAELLPARSKAVLVTGCDSGFGHVLAQRLSEMGVMVFAGVLDANGAGARRLREGASGNLQVLQLDVTDGRQIETAHRHVCAQVSATGLWGLVNNAGVFQCPADAELQPIAAYRFCMDVNFLGAVKMSQVFLPLLRRSRGRIVNMSSMAGEVPMPMLTAYGASKAALSVVTAAMRMELSAWGVKVALIQPAGFRTTADIFGTGDDAARHRDQILAAVSPEAREDYGEAYISSLPSSLSRMSQDVAGDLSPVVDDMCHALLSVRPKPVYAPGQMGRLLPFLHRCCPTALFDTIMINFVRHTELQPTGLNRS